MEVLIGALVGVSVPTLRVVLEPATRFICIDEDVAVLDLGGEAFELLLVVVGADSAVDAVVPLVKLADDVATWNVATGEQCTAVEATTVEDGVVFVIADYDEVDVFDEGADRITIGQFGPGSDPCGLHSSSSIGSGSMMSEDEGHQRELLHQSASGATIALTDLRAGADRVRTMSETPEPIDDVIRAAGLRRTAPRALVLRTLWATRGHLTASEIFEQLEAKRTDEPMAQSTVYRALEALEAKGVVSALRSRNGETRYEWAPERPGHHHLLCNSCGGVMELDLGTVRELAAEIEERTGFQPEIRHLAIDGLCSYCQPADESAVAPPA